MKVVIIPKNRLASLLRDSDKLSRLEHGGVDNWDWYDESLNNDPSYEKIQDMSDNDLIDFYGYKVIEI